MIRKIIAIIVLVMMFTSCDKLLSFFVSPNYYVPALKFGWTVDNVNSKIVGDPAYFYNFDPNSPGVEWQLFWNILPNSLYFQEYWGSDTNVSESNTGMPFELMNYENIDSPLFYLNLLFRHDFNMGSK